LPRPQSLDGLTIGILDIAKSRGDVFLHRLGERPAPLPLRQQIATEVDLVIEGLSD